MASSPASSLSSLPSDDLPEDARMHDASGDDFGDHDPSVMRPLKRRRLHNTAASYTRPYATADDISDISSDGFSDVPDVPRLGGVQSMPDDYALAADQVRSCSWEGCDAGTLENMDALVDHISREHIGTMKRAKYTCEWEACKAKGKPQMSAYALKAHMRSHTKEKPFFCALPGMRFVQNLARIDMHLTRLSRMRQIVHEIGRACQAHAHCP